MMSETDTLLFLFPKKTYTLEGDFQQVRKPEELGKAEVLPRGKYGAARETMIPFRPKPK